MQKWTLICNNISDLRNLFLACENNFCDIEWLQKHAEVIFDVRKGFLVWENDFSCVRKSSSVYENSSDYDFWCEIMIFGVGKWFLVCEIGLWYTRMIFGMRKQWLVSENYFINKWKKSFRNSFKCYNVCAKISFVVWKWFLVWINYIWCGKIKICMLYFTLRDLILVCEIDFWCARMIFTVRIWFLFCGNDFYYAKMILILREWK